MGGLAFLAQEYSRLPGEKCAGAALSCPCYGQGAILCMQITTRRLSYSACLQCTAVQVDFCAMAA